MPAPIAPVSVNLPVITPAKPATQAPAEAFGSVFQDAISRVEQFRLDAQSSVDRFLSGDSEELHTVALKAQQAELSFELFLQVRNKIVNAYQEVMRMQV